MLLAAIAFGSSAVEAMLPWSAVFLFSLLVAVCELISRFRDAPIRLAKSPLAFLYCFINISAALLAFQIIQVFGWKAGLPDSEGGKIIWLQTCTAGFSAMVLLRSSLFRVRIGTQDVDVGPGAVLQQLLAAVDRAIDRQEGQLRLQSIDAFWGFKFDETAAAAPALCAGVLQSLTADQQKDLKKSIDAIIGGAGTEQTKLRLLALELMNVCGPSILKEVAEKLRTLPIS